MSGDLPPTGQPWAAQCADGHIFLSGPKCPWCELDRLRAENAALRADAERYRYIRDNHETRGRAMEIVYGMN
ncbi:MAG: hypothetical protein MUC86_07550, partial [Burkholderiaceae bacterium]|nr:hypothetical protein [Burkholderiaceae bacterium]